MKTTMKRILAAVLVCVIVLTFTACARTLEGTYVSKDTLVECTLTFDKENRVEISGSFLGFELPEAVEKLINGALKCEYKIEKGEITFTYNILGISGDIVQTFEKKGDSIFVNGTEFVKDK